MTRTLSIPVTAVGLIAYDMWSTVTDPDVERDEHWTGGAIVRLQSQDSDTTIELQVPLDVFETLIERGQVALPTMREDALK